MATFRDQLSAFLFKNLALSKTKKGSQIGILIVFPALFVAICVAFRMIIVEFNIKQNRSIPKEQSGTILPDKDFDKSMPKYRQYFVVICESKDTNVVNVCNGLKSKLRERIAPNLNFNSSESFDNWYVTAKKNEKDSDDFSHFNIKGVFTVRNSEKSSNVEIILSTQKDNFSRFDSSLIEMIYYLLEGQRGGDNYSVVKIKKGDISSPFIFYVLRSIFGICAGSCILISLVLFVQFNITEKEDRIIMLMQLNGITINGYLMSQLIFYAALGLIPLALGTVCLILSPFSDLTSPAFYLAFLLMIILLIQVPLASICLSFILKRKMVAISFSILLSFFLPLSLVPKLYFNSSSTNPASTLIPIYGTFIGVFSVSAISGHTFLGILKIPEFWMSFTQSIITIAFLYLFAIYLYNVVEQGYSGTLKKWHYPISDLYYHLTRRNSKVLRKNKAKKFESAEVIGMDSDVKEMMELVDNDFERATKDHLLVYSHINKVYPSGNQAVDEVTLALKGNQTFALLGPNGAGKTTLMFITAGLFESSSGKVVLNGLTNRNAFRSMIGFCPQHDIYWKALTVRQHLRFFFLLRGTNRLYINQKIAEILHSVRLTNYADIHAGKLSGGERRRLSLAMALSGDSKVILLDEPTTGLDPKVRRIVWDIITEARGNRLMILTTHSMEEAEILSSELTIMAHGRLKCFGTVAHLKKKFGGQIFISFENYHGRFQDAVQGIKECCPFGAEAHLVHEGLEGLSGRLLFIGDKIQALALMKSLVSRISDYGIASFGVVQSSLDDVFMNIVRAQDADA